MVWAVAVTYYRASEGLHRMKPRLFMFRKVIFEPVSNAGSEQEFQRDCTKTKHAKIQDDKLLFCQGHLFHLSLSMMTWCGYSADSRHSGASPGRGTLHTNPRGLPGHSWPDFGNMWKTRKKSLVGGAINILKNDGVRQWEGWHPIYEMENKKNVWNQQPDNEHITSPRGGKKHDPTRKLMHVLWPAQRVLRWNRWNGWQITGFRELVATQFYDLSNMDQKNNVPKQILA